MGTVALLNRLNLLPQGYNEMARVGGRVRKFELSDFPELSLW